MPQPKSSSGRSRKRAPRATAKREDEDVARGITALREVLARAVVLPAERLRELMDDAVRRGRMTRDDAEDLVQSLIALGRRQTEDVLADVEQLFGRQRATTTEVRKRTAQGADKAAKEVDRARASSDGFPIAGYDDLAAAQIISRLDGLSPAQLRKVRDYERRHGNRKTVLSAVERKLG